MVEGILIAIATGLVIGVASIIVGGAIVMARFVSKLHKILDRDL